MVDKETEMAPREKAFLLARPEGAVLRWIARRVPARLVPDHFTVLALVAAVGIAAAYALSGAHPWLLWAAAGLLVVHWLGDSLDGTLARERRIERPRYGYYLDHLADAVATALIGIGLGLSPHLALASGMALVIAYFALSINTYLETHALGVFRLGYGRLGPTEARLALIGVTVALALGVALPLDAIVLGASAVMAAGLALRAAAVLRELARREPAPRYGRTRSTSMS
ncbi:MAG: CDP-alcohol phosphatidyltransferase family protein [Solirubrobacteraceae bacterium]